MLPHFMKRVCQIASKFRGIFGVAWSKLENVYVRYIKVSCLVPGGPQSDRMSSSPEAETEHKDRTLCLLIHRTCNPCYNMSWTEGKKPNNFKYESKSKVINVDINMWVLVLKYMSKSMQPFQELVAKMHIY